MRPVFKRSLPMAAAWLVIAALSILVVARATTDPSFHQASLAALEEKQSTVLDLTAAATAGSAAITLLPGDLATPIAEKLADLSGYFLIVLCAIFLEKYLLTITAGAAFYLLVPAACGLAAVNAFLHKDGLRRLALRLAAFGLAVALVVPASIWVSGLIERTYEASISATLSQAKETAEDTQQAAQDAQSDTDSSGGLSGLFSKVTGTVTGAVSGAIDRFKTMVNRLLEALAVMIVTSCLIPILVLLFFVWVGKLLLGSLFSVTQTAPAPREKAAAE